MWRESPLSELAVISSGGTPSRDIAGYWDGDIPWVTPTDITACRTNYLATTAEKITKNGLLNSSAKLLPAGSILLTSRATIGISKIAATPVCTNQGFKNLLPLNGVDGRFLFYQVQRLKGDFERFAAGSTFLEINKKDTARVLIPHPESLLVQERIATVLSEIDTTIEKTEALIAKYQQIKAGLMHDLFSRGVLPNGQLRPTREQAQELYQETAIGWIPKEWRVSTLEQCLIGSPKNGYSPRETDTWKGVYVLGLGCLTKEGFQPKQLKNAPKEALASGALLNDGDFLISRANTPELVGLCGIFRDIGSSAIYPDLMMRLALNDLVHSDFLEAQLLSPFTRARLTALAVGTSSSMAKLNAASIRKFQIFLPQVAEQELLIQSMRPLQNIIRTHEANRSKLRLKKFGLMQDLLTGKVQVNVDAPEPAHA